MATRTAELIATALRQLPPRPDASILFVTEQGESKYEEEEVFMDLVSRGRVAGPEREAAAAAAGVVGRWELAWRSAPLILHDAGLVGAVDALAPELADASDELSIDAIGRALENHPGPVRLIRVESSKFLSPEQVGAWMDLIRAKEGGRRRLEELVLINSAGPRNTVFPLHLLPGGLRSLTLGFFVLRPLRADHLSSLIHLQITGCDLSGLELSAAITKLHGLTTLVLGCCTVTRGCGPEGLSIVSSSLSTLQLWSCTASGGVELQYTPRLHCLCTGVRPPHGRGRLRIDIRTTAALRELHGLMMYYHDLTYSSTSTGRLHRHNIAPLPNLGTLRVCLQMFTAEQTLELLDLLRHLPRLMRLVLVRVDDADPAEDDRVAVQAFNIPCITDSLRHLMLQSFRGGAAELAFATHILATARELAYIALQPHTALPQEAASQAITSLNMCPMISEAVAIYLLSND